MSDYREPALADARGEMRYRDEQMLEMVLLCEQHMDMIFVDQDDEVSVIAWETVSKNLGLARVVIEARLRDSTDEKDEHETTGD